ncbi:MAG: hypothetical protein J6O51_00945 [Bacteroidales bacterium]|nr:hypothetical protein [Bacteroidales bacterium]
MLDLSEIDIEKVSLQELEERNSIMPPVKPMPEGRHDEDEDDELEGAAVSKVLKTRYSYRRAYSEIELLDSLQAPGFVFEPGTAYNFMTRGDVDALSFLRLILRSQKVERLTLSTWCIGRLDVWLGEIYRGNSGRHGVTVASMREALNGLEGVTVRAGRNHAKVMAGRGYRFDFVILTSANINTNPRIESAVVEIPFDHTLVEFYEDFFSTVKEI